MIATIQNFKSIPRFSKPSTQVIFVHDGELLCFATQLEGLSRHFETFHAPHWLANGQLHSLLEKIPGNSLQNRFSSSRCFFEMLGLNELHDGVVILTDERNSLSRQLAVKTYESLNEYFLKNKVVLSWGTIDPLTSRLKIRSSTSLADSTFLYFCEKMNLAMDRSTKDRVVIRALPRRKQKLYLIARRSITRQMDPLSNLQLISYNYSFDQEGEILVAILHSLMAHILNTKPQSVEEKISILVEAPIDQYGADYLAMMQECLNQTYEVDIHFMDPVSKSIYKLDSSF